ncbi:phytosulfokine receptor 1-like [Zingiber officinale]|uniref:non-specific serine/threonine protein kinase n=1 Tax=Zingiber officinale TaxID=94328 RepID=A0A8J5LZT2_ZINOF|nr:phytosulfokine receptor 1-like [Zingiber officinale]KAG6529367.1 hypothetical protein ZIOFF_011565 [Zingiber officinale]
MVAKKGGALDVFLAKRISSFLFFFGLLLLCLCLCLCTRSQEQACHPDELEALLEFSGELDSEGRGWSFNASSTDCCSWPGVYCGGGSPDSGPRVIGLDFQNQSLKGSLSHFLADLSYLKWLNLSYNSLHGPVPSTLFRHRQLEVLNLEFNDFSGSIPADLYLPSIRHFNVSYNFFNGTLPLFVGSAHLILLDVSFNAFSGTVPTAICASTPGVRFFIFSMNLLSGEIPAAISNCTSLQELSLDLNEISGNLPPQLFMLSSLRILNLQENQLSGGLSSSLGNLSNLEQLDLSVNSFSGRIPDVFGSLRMLAYISIHSNSFDGPLPSSLSSASSLRVLNLRNNSLSGDISLDCARMKKLLYLDLGSNFFSGHIPSTLHQCVELRTLNLARNNLSGQLPNSFKNFTRLSYLSLSNNSLSNISSAMEILQGLPSLAGLVLTMNFHDYKERMPVNRIHGFHNLQVLVIANCGLSGSVPPWLANCTKLLVLDFSWNHLRGTIPSWIGKFDYLFYLDLSNNSLSGNFPESLAHVQGLISPNRSLLGASTDYFPFFIKRNNSGKGLQYNQLSSFPPSLILGNNLLVGSILPGLGNLKNLHTLDLSRNKLSGAIPEQLSGMSSIESLDLSHNQLNGSIPLSLTSLNFLSSFSVAFNNLTGFIPTGGQFSTFSGSDFEGNPSLCGYHLNSCNSDVPQLPKQADGDGRSDKNLIVGMVTGTTLGTILLLVIIYLFVSRTQCRREDSVEPVMDTNGNSKMEEGSRLVLLFQNKENKELSIGDIMRSTNSFDQANIIGCGGFGLVYKATLPDGSNVAIKRLSGDYGQMEREFQAEVEALSRAQHANLVLLQGYCKIGNDRLLIYSFMENGSLDYWLHEKVEGAGSILDWNKRLRIAQGAARGLAYLHQSCDPHILHRDIKSSNILLDNEFEAHLADFGLARLILPYDTHVTTDLVGTLGYIPPEYGQSSVATFRGDIYSLGVVLLELLTGRRPLDMCKPRAARELVSWVLLMKAAKREAEVFDPHVYDKLYEYQMLKMLEIAHLCLNNSPKMRPSTNELATWLENINNA